MTTTHWRKAKKLSLRRLNKLTIASGAHISRDEDLCGLELVAWLAGEPHSDHPECACPVIAAMVRRLNDRIPDDATRTRVLRPLLPLALNTAAGPKVTLVRVYIAADYACREAAPLALEARGRRALAVRLRALDPIVDRKAAAAAAVAAVAYVNAANDAAATAVVAYAVAAADDAADNAVNDAAASAANAVVAYAANVKVKEKIYKSAADCIRRMCAVTTAREEVSN
jgi:hypothetical protein